MKTILVGLLIAGAFSVPALPALAQAPGLVSYWPGNGNYRDVVGPNNGTAVGSVPFGPGRINKTFEFDGTSGRIFVHDSPSLMITSSIAVSAWMKCDAIPAGALCSDIIFRGDDRPGLDPYLFVVQTDDNLDFELNNGTTAVDLATPAPFGTWAFVCASLDATTGLMQDFINGEVAASTYTNVVPFAQLDQNDNPGVGIGDLQSDADNEHFQGDIEEVRLYNTPGPMLYPKTLKLLSEAVTGGQEVQGVVILDDSPFVSVKAQLKSDSVVAKLPHDVTIPYGRTKSGGFAIKTSPVTVQTTVHISANLNGATATATLTINP